MVQTKGQFTVKFINCFFVYTIIDSNLTNLADSIESIEDETFMGCSSLKTPWIPQNLRKIGNRAFMGCSSIGRIFIPDTVEEIGEQAFGNCPQLVIVCQQDSAAYRYAVSNKIVFEVTV